MDNKFDPSAISRQRFEQAADRLQRLELAVRCAAEGLSRWQERCFEHVSRASLSGAEITLLLQIGSGERSKTIKELAAATNRVDIPNIQYSLRKLAAAGLTCKRGAGRSGVSYSLTDEGREAAGQMNAARERLLQVLGGRPGLAGPMEMAAEALEELAALYEAVVRETEAKGIT